MSSTLEVEQVVQNLTARPDASKPVTSGGNPDLWETVVKVRTNVRNTGSLAGATVAQLYVSLPSDKVPTGTPVKVLRGFEKTRLEPSQSVAVEFQLTRRDLSYWNVALGDLVIPDGAMKFATGLSSRDIETEMDHVVRA